MVAFHLEVAAAPSFRLFAVAFGLVLVGTSIPSGLSQSPPEIASPPFFRLSLSNSSPVNNFTASVDRLVDLLGVAGSGLLALAWARVAVSWFSHDVTKKVQAKDRARDALVGTLLFVAALSGLIWGLAHWVLTGS
jgi:hypothetical protein